MTQLFMLFLLSVLSLFLALGLSFVIKRALTLNKILGGFIFIILFPIILVFIAILLGCILAIALTFFSFFI